MNRINKGLAFFIGILILGSCFNPPEFPTVPHIEFNRVEFIDSSTGSDSLVIYIDFKDGDGDLGLDGEDDLYRDAPFNDTFFFQENNGKLDTLSTNMAHSATDDYYVLLIPNPSKGKLVNFRTHKKAPYNTILPSVFNCTNYEFVADRTGTTASGRKLLIERSAYAVLPAGAKVVDTLSSAQNVFYQIRDTLYIARNPNHNNIEVEFFYKDPNNPLADADGFVEFDWYKYNNNCDDFNKRFPVLTQHENSLEGTLSYAMISLGFQANFSVKTMKLRLQVKDRALNKSNIITTPEFTLDKIKKKR